MSDPVLLGQIGFLNLLGLGSGLRVWDECLTIKIPGMQKISFNEHFTNHLIIQR